MKHFIFGGFIVLAIGLSAYSNYCDQSKPPTIPELPDNDMVNKWFKSKNDSKVEKIENGIKWSPVKKPTTIHRYFDPISFQSCEKIIISMIWESDGYDNSNKEFDCSKTDPEGKGTGIGDGYLRCLAGTGDFRLGFFESNKKIGNDTCEGNKNKKYCEPINNEFNDYKGFQIRIHPHLNEGFKNLDARLKQKKTNESHINVNLWTRKDKGENGLMSDECQNIDHCGFTKDEPYGTQPQKFGPNAPFGKPIPIQIEFKKISQDGLEFEAYITIGNNKSPILHGKFRKEMLPNFIDTFAITYTNSSRKYGYIKITDFKVEGLPLEDNKITDNDIADKIPAQYLNGKKINNEDGSCNEDGLKAYLALLKDENELKRGPEWDHLRPKCWVTTANIRFRLSEKSKQEDYLKEYESYIKSDLFKNNQKKFTELDMTASYIGYHNIGDSCLPLKQGKCSKGWIECRDMCYSIITRNTGGPNKYEDENDNIELRCQTCQGGRVALINKEDKEMLKFVDELYKKEDVYNKKADNFEKGIWIRTQYFNEKPIYKPYFQPWLKYITMYEEDSKNPVTYERYIKGKWEQKSYEGDILCIQNIGKTEDKKNDGKACAVKNQYHKWNPEYDYPCSGC